MNSIIANPRNLSYFLLICVVVSGCATGKDKLACYRLDAGGRCQPASNDDREARGLKQSLRNFNDNKIDYKNIEDMNNPY